MRLLLLLLALRVYHPTMIEQFATFKRTHVEVCGTVTVVRKEHDGDIHIRLVDGQRFLIAEIVPYHPLPTPLISTSICVSGIRRYDDQHGWWEVHPVERWKPLRRNRR